MCPTLKPLDPLCSKLCWWCSQDPINWCSGFPFLATVQTNIKDRPIFRMWQEQTKMSLTHPDGKTTKLSFTVMNLYGWPHRHWTTLVRCASSEETHPEGWPQHEEGNIWLPTLRSSPASSHWRRAGTLEVAQRRTVSDVDCNSANKFWIPWDFVDWRDQ